MQHVDSELFETFKSIKSETPIYEQLRNVPALESERARFIDEGYDYNPALEPTVVLTEETGRRDALLTLRDKLLNSDTDQIIIDSYLPRIEASLLGSTMLQAAAVNDVEAFVAANEDLYGVPDPVVFNNVSNYFVDYAKKIVHEPANTEAKDAAQEALDSLETTPVSQIWPTEAEFAEVKHLFDTFFDQMFDGIEIPETLRGEAVFEITRRVLANLGYDYQPVPQASGVSTMSVNQRKKVVKIPFDELYSASRLKGLLGHEVRIHVEETENGKQQKLYLLSDGLRGHTAAGEGKGVLVEQVAYDSLSAFMATRRFFDIARRNLSIGLARGVDGNGERDFKEIFKVIHALDRAWEYSESGADAAAINDQAFVKSWELLTKRTLKGVSGRGAAYYKDKVYAEGNPRQWRLLIDHPETYPYLNLGHYDLSDPEHVRILKAVGTVPPTLLASR